MEPYQQGSLDGLCGIYSVINAVRLVVGRLKEEECFNILHQSLMLIEQKRKLSAIVVEGVSILEIAQVFRKVIDKEYKIKRTKPFHTSPNTPLSAYWNKVMTFLNSGSNRAVLLGIEDHDWDHWTVLKAATEKRFIQFDSCGAKQIIRKKCTTKKLTKARTNLIKPTMTYFLSRL